jgi:dynein light chain LC8-type
VSEEMQAKAVEITSKALTQYNLERDIAMQVKKEFDRVYGTTWHCVVGKK